MESSNLQKPKLPAIVSDIDGVVYKGPECCGNSPQIVSSLLLEKYGDHPKPIPFVFLTNGGIETEDEKAASLNKIMDLKNFQTNKGIDTPHLLTDSHIIMSHTPLGEPQLVSKYNNSEGFVLVMGRPDV